MPIILHHNDDDGRCSAAVIYNECVRGRYMMDPAQCVEWVHGMPAPRLDVSELHSDDTVYIVDLALDDDILSCIADVLQHRKDLKIVHIDHHITSVNRYAKMKAIRSNDLNDPSNLYLKYVKNLFMVGYSATLLCWAYAAFDENEREDLANVKFDFADQVSHVLIDGLPNSNRYREVRIPMVLRYIDDYDVWRRALDPNTEYFHYAFFGVSGKDDVMGDLWSGLIYNQDLRVVETFLQAGEAITRYMKANSKSMMRNAFVSSIDGIEVLCLNGYGNSSVFGEEIKNYPACCIFHYDGQHHNWKYSMYSDNEKGIDVAQICESHGGGGHVHAAGFSAQEMIFT